jgi:germination protein M
MKRSLMVLVVVLLGLAACGGEAEPAASQPPPGEQPGEEGSPEPTAEPAPETFTYETWFQKGDFLYSVSREAPKTPRVGTVAMESLLSGPSEEDGKGITTSIPNGTELLGLTIEDGDATVDLSSRFDDGGGSASMTSRLAQVVFTLTQFPTVDGVTFQIDGEVVDVFSGEGIVLDGPQTRGDFEELAPPIIVSAPMSGDRVTSPVTISGTANVFEATVSFRILDSDGNVIKRAFTTATCGTGCRGDYSKDVAFDVSEDQGGSIEVFESSAKDGSALHTVRIPVTLVP